MGLAGIPWWTSDIGGFVGGDGKDPAFRGLLVRWFEWGAFCPVFRLHGERLPYYEREVEYIDGVRTFSSGQDNEVWSFGEENYEIMKKFLFIRENLRDYVRNCMMEAHLHGTPVMRPLFYDFPEDKTCWGYEDEYVRTGYSCCTSYGSTDIHTFRISSCGNALEGCRIRQNV